MARAMESIQIQERKKELVDILLDSVYYLDLDLVERKRLLCFLMERFFPALTATDGKPREMAQVRCGTAAAVAAQSATVQR